MNLKPDQLINWRVSIFYNCIYVIISVSPALIFEVQLRWLLRSDLSPVSRGGNSVSHVMQQRNWRGCRISWNWKYLWCCYLRKVNMGEYCLSLVNPFLLLEVYCVHQIEMYTCIISPVQKSVTSVIYMYIMLWMWEYTWRLCTCAHWKQNCWCCHV